MILYCTSKISFAFVNKREYTRLIPYVSTIRFAACYTDEKMTNLLLIKQYTTKPDIAPHSDKK